VIDGVGVIEAADIDGAADSLAVEETVALYVGNDGKGVRLPLDVIEEVVLTVGEDDTENVTLAVCETELVAETVDVTDNDVLGVDVGL
jgi:hypothetical protein